MAVTACKTAQQVESGGRLVVRLDHAGRVWDPRFRGEFLPIDDITPATAMCGFPAIQAVLTCIAGLV